MVCVGGVHVYMCVWCVCVCYMVCVCMYVWCVCVCVHVCEFMYMSMCVHDVYGVWVCVYA